MTRARSLTVAALWAARLLSAFVPPMDVPIRLNLGLGGTELIYARLDGSG